MRIILFLSVFLLCSAPATAQPTPSGRTITAADGMVVQVQVNGHPVRLRVDPGVGLVLNPDAAARIGLRPSMLHPSMRIGPTVLSGDSKVARLRIGAWEGRRRFYWFDRTIVEGADGAISMDDLPEQTITLDLGPAAPNETRHIFAVESNNVRGLIHRHQAGERRIDVRFTLLPARSYASAAAGAILSELNNGAWISEANGTVMVFGVERPLRPMRFANPVLLGTYPIEEIGVRTADYRGGHALPTDASQEDPSEIVVTGNRPSGRAIYLLAIGRDRLAACSSIIYSKPLRTLTLSCRPS